jgi:SAM-dependent methyltransferase
MKNQHVDPVWEDDIYSKGMHLNRYPFDAVVSFVFGYHPRDRAREDVRIVELGCGAGNNLWFAAREGFDVAGIDSSTSAIAAARARFEEEGLRGDLQVGSFECLPWEEQSCDLAIDRHSLVCVSRSVQKEAIHEVRRVLRTGGLFLSCVYSDKHTSAQSGTRLPDGRTADIKSGTLTGVGGITFSSRQDIEELFNDGWEVVSLEHVDVQDCASAENHAEWRVLVKKI